VYTGPITVSNNETVQAIAVASGYNNSGVASAIYAITPPAPTPTFSLAGGTYTTVQTVALSCSNTSAAIYYTTDGSMPSTSSAVYSSALSVSANETISAIALASGGSKSAVASATYTIVLPTATPVFSLAAGKYTGTQSVTVSDTTANAAIYFTIDGSTPTASSALYSGPISVAASETVEAVAVTSGGSLSPVAKAAYQITPITAVPVISPAAGTYNGAQTVTIVDSTPNAIIYYTINGKMPNSSSTVYSGPLSISTNSNIQAIAQAPSYASSATAVANFAFGAATPVISPAAGTYLTTQSIKITTSTPGASIYYTNNGTTPTSGSNLYTGPISVSTNETIEAVTVLSGLNNSPAASSAYVITPPAPAPSFSPAAGTYLKVETVSINCSNKSAVIYYTTDGSTPSTGSLVYSSPLTVGSNETINAMALAPGGSNSSVSSAAYTIELPAASPVFSVASGKYTSVQTVSLSDATASASIYYTTDGSTPTSLSNLYSGPITVAASENFEAIALAPGGSASPVAKAGYTITLPTAIPVISPASGTYNSIQTVTIADATPGAVIYYTVNGSYPTTNSPVYSAPITATTTTMIQAIAIAPTDSMSASAETNYAIVAPPPSITPASGTFDYTATVVMSSTIPGATIYYTSNGTTPTPSSAVYTGPIVVSPKQSTTESFSAIQIAPGYLLSAANSNAITVTLPSGILAQATVNTTPQLTIAPNFLGLSADFYTPSTLFGQQSTGVNQVYRNLLGNLTANSTAPLLFRIEADNSTVAGLQADVEPLNELAQNVNINYTLGIDLITNSVALAESEAAVWANGVPSQYIAAFEIGNEPDAYVNSGNRPSPFTFPEYLAQFQQWQQAVQTGAGSQFGVMGPSAAGSGWNAGVEAGLAVGTMTPVLVSQHAYLTPAPAGQTLPPDFLLQPSSTSKLPGYYIPFAVSAHQSGFKFRMGEINSICNGGVRGISDTFQAALWSIDIMFTYLNGGVDGVNWHSGQYTAYALWEFQPKTYAGKTTFNFQGVSPLYYGLLSFQQVAGNGAQLLPVATMTDSNVSIWATVDSTSTAHVVVINKDEAATGNIQINLPGYTTGTVRYLSAPSYASTNGVTLGGQTFDGTPDGTIQGSLVTTTITGQNGVFTLPDMPITTAAIIDFTN